MLSPILGVCNDLNAKDVLISLLSFQYTSLVMEQDRPLFADRPEWADVVPLEQYEGATPIAPIFYTPECAYAMSFSIEPS